MSDIVERLRQARDALLSGDGGHVDLPLTEAADEIERLRAELVAANREAEILLNAMIQLGGHVGTEQLPDVAGKITQISNLVAGLRAEIERMQGVVSAVNRRCDHLGMTVRDIKKERDAAYRAGQEATKEAVADMAWDRRGHFASDSAARAFSELVRALDAD